MLVQAVNDIVSASVESLDTVVNVNGFGAAMLEAGLVGIVDDGLVLPAELRNQQRHERGGRAAADREDQGDKVERERKQARVRQRRRRAGKALSKPVTSPSPTVADTRAKWTPRRLGEIDGHAVMLLYSPKTEAWFYCLKNAEPEEWYASVADPENPSFAEALAGLHATMKRKIGKGLCDGDALRPSLKAVVDAAERYRTERAAVALDDARRDEANRAAAEAAAEDREDIDHEPAERDCHADVTLIQRDTVTVTEVSRLESVTCPPNSNESGDLGNGECHAPVTVTAPSSSSSLSVSGFHEDKSKENTTTTSSVTPAERDHEDRILDLITPQVTPEQTRQQAQEQRWLERIAQALDTTPEAVKYQRANLPHVLLARLKAKGIDPRAGLAVEAHHEPADARDNTGVTVEPIAGHEPGTGNVDARGDGGDGARLEDEDVDRPRHDPWRTVMALKQNGIPLPSLRAAPGRGHRLEDVDFEQHEQANVAGLAVGHEP